MATTVIRFEAQLPVTEFGTADYNAVQTFMNNMGSLAPSFYYQVYQAPQGQNQFFSMYGYITTAQEATALGYLNTLNAALSTGPVLCVVWNGTKEP